MPARPRASSVPVLTPPPSTGKTDTASGRAGRARRPTGRTRPAPPPRPSSTRRTPLAAARVCRRTASSPRHSAHAVPLDAGGRRGRALVVPKRAARVPCSVSRGRRLPPRAVLGGDAVQLRDGVVGSPSAAPPTAMRAPTSAPPVPARARGRAWRLSYSAAGRPLVVVVVRARLRPASPSPARRASAIAFHRGGAGRRRSRRARCACATRRPLAQLRGLQRVARLRLGGRRPRVGVGARAPPRVRAQSRSASSSARREHLASLRLRTTSASTRSMRAVACRTTSSAVEEEAARHGAGGAYGRHTSSALRLISRSSYSRRTVNRVFRWEVTTATLSPDRAAWHGTTILVRTLGKADDELRRSDQTDGTRRWKGCGQLLSCDASMKCQLLPPAPPPPLRAGRLAAFSWSRPSHARSSSCGLERNGEAARVVTRRSRCRSGVRASACSAGDRSVVGVLLW